MRSVSETITARDDTLLVLFRLIKEIKSNLSIFQFDSLEIRFVEIEGITYAVGVDVARALGYENPRDTVNKKVNAEYKGVCILQTPGGNQDVTCISEAGIYQLIFGSKLEGADGAASR